MYSSLFKRFVGQHYSMLCVCVCLCVYVCVCVLAKSAKSPFKLLHVLCPDLEPCVSWPVRQSQAFLSVRPSLPLLSQPREEGSDPTARHPSSSEHIVATSRLKILYSSPAEVSQPPPLPPRPPHTFQNKWQGLNDCLF